MIIRVIISLLFVKEDDANHSRSFMLYYTRIFEKTDEILLELGSYEVISNKSKSEFRF